MRRREFVGLVGGAAVVWPLAARGQPAIPVVGFIHSQSPEAFAHLVAAFLAGLGETGYVEGQNVAIEYRWAEGQLDRLPALAAELVELQVAVIYAGSGGTGALPVKAATSTIPMVFSVSEDPVALGLVNSLSRPGGNATGHYGFNSDLEARRLGLLRDLVATGSTIAVLFNPTKPGSPSQLDIIQEAARALAQPIEIVYASTEPEIDAAFAAIAALQVAGLHVAGDAFFNTRRAKVVALAASLGIPAIYERSEFTSAGGLMSYGTNLAATYRRGGVYVGRILNGERPADMPVGVSTDFEFVINLRTARALGITIPPTLLALADEVIE